jgi:hypothetical protein
MLLDTLQDYIKKQPGLTAGKIAKELGVTRKEINSLLYKHNKKIFTRVDHGEKAPTWTSFSASEDIREHVSVDKPEIIIENPGKMIMKKILEEIDLELSANDRFETKTGSVKIEVVVASEGMNSNFTRFEILEVDDLIIIINDDSYLSNFDGRSLENAVALHVLHCIADCLTQYKLNRTKVVEEDFIPTKNEIFLKLLSMKLIKRLK